jgi:hypothetical protein
MLKRLLPVGFVCTPTTADLMGFFYLMIYTTKTRIDNDYIVIEVHADGAFWHDYLFPIHLKDDLLSHVEDKVWCTVKNYKEIQRAIYESRNNSI